MKSKITHILLVFLLSAFVLFGQDSNDFNEVWIKTRNSDIIHTGYLYRIDNTSLYTTALKLDDVKDENIVSIPLFEIEHLKIKTDPEWRKGARWGSIFGGLIVGSIVFAITADDRQTGLLGDLRPAAGLLGGMVGGYIIGGVYQYQKSKYKKYDFSRKASKIPKYKKEIEKKYSLM